MGRASAPDCASDVLTPTFLGEATHLSPRVVTAERLLCERDAARLVMVLNCLWLSTET